MEQTLNQRNSPRNMSGTNSLKALANNVLGRNKGWKNPGTVATKSVPPMPQSSIACGTNAEIGKGEVYNFLYEFEERLAIAEYDGHQTPLQAERIAYQGAFIDVLNTLPYEDGGKGDWFDHRIRAAKEWLISQRLVQPK